MNIKQKVILLTVLVLAAAKLLFLGCSNEPKSDIFFIVREIKDIYDMSPVPPYSSFHETEMVVDLGNRGKGTISFDMLTAEFYASENLICGCTIVVADDDSVNCYYSTGENKEPPLVTEIKKLFSLPSGYATKFVLRSANSNFALFTPETPRKIVVTLVKDGAVIYGPFDIKIPSRQEGTLEK